MKMHFLVRKCIVPECGNMSTMGDGCFKTYFEFPSDKTLKEQWFSAILYKPGPDEKDIKICDDHFGPEAKFTTTNSWKRLRLGSTPTLKLPKYVCRTCYKTVDNRKQTDKQKLCSCTNPNPKSFPRPDPATLKNEKEEKASEKEDKSRKHRDVSSSRKDPKRSSKEEGRREKEKKSRDADTRRRERVSSSSERSRKSTTSNDRKEAPSSSRSRSTTTSSNTKLTWSNDEREALVNCIEKFGRMRKTPSGQMLIDWVEVGAKYREKGFFGNEKELRMVWRYLRSRAKKVHDDEMYGTKLERKVSRLLFGRKTAPRLGMTNRDSSLDSERGTSGSSKNQKENQIKKRSPPLKRPKQDSENSDSDGEKYGTYKIVSKSEKTRHKEKEKDRPKEGRREKQRTKRRRIISITENSDSESDKENQNGVEEEDRSSGFGEMDTDRENSEVDDSKVKCGSSSEDEYMTRQDVEEAISEQKLYCYEGGEKLDVKHEEASFGIWEIKTEAGKEDSEDDKSDEEENDDEQIDISSDEDECLGLEDLRKLGVDVDEFLLRKDPQDIEISDGFESDDSQKTVLYTPNKIFNAKTQYASSSDEDN